MAHLELINDVIAYYRRLIRESQAAGVGVKDLQRHLARWEYKKRKVMFEKQEE
jgi:hypothetical protein